MTEALRRHDFDTVLMALNAAQSANPVAARKMEPIPAFEQSALPVALQKNMGILSMKVMGQGMLVGNGAGRASPAELLQFNLSQPVASVVIGCEQMAPLEENMQAALNFTPISESGKQKLQEKVAPSRSAWQHFLRVARRFGGGLIVTLALCSFSGTTRKRPLSTAVYAQSMI